MEFNNRSHGVWKYKNRLNNKETLDKHYVQYKSVMSIWRLSMLQQNNKLQKEHSNNTEHTKKICKIYSNLNRAES